MKLIREIRVDDWVFSLYFSKGQYHSFVYKNGCQQVHVVLSVDDDEASARKWHKQYVRECLSQIEQGAM